MLLTLIKNPASERYIAQTIRSYAEIEGVRGAEELQKILRFHRSGSARVLIAVSRRPRNRDFDSRRPA